MAKWELLNHNQTPITSSRVWYAAVADPGDISNGPPRALMVTGAGDITMEDENGTEWVLTVTASQNAVALSPTKITALTATVWLLY